MDKYAVVTPTQDKTAEEGGRVCPECGATATLEDGVLRCPNCGTAPFEAT